MEYITELFTPVSENLLIQGDYSVPLVLLSIFIAIVASFMGLQVSTAAATSVNKRRRFYTKVAGSMALGGGVWSMHFIGMLAFQLCTPVDYDFTITSLSLIPSLLASWVTLTVLNQSSVSPHQIIIGGVSVGAGIGAMHYAGMAAMEMSPLLRYDLVMFGVSIVVAVVLAILALTIKFGLQKAALSNLSSLQINVLAGIVMGCAISGMHYTGMAAARFVMPPGFEPTSQSEHISAYLAIGVTALTLLMILIVLAVNALFKYKDISEKASASEARIRAMMETAADGIITIDHKARVVSANPAVGKLLGWSPDELMGLNVNVLVPDIHYNNHDGYVKKYLETHQANIIGRPREVEAKHKNGQLIPVRLSIGHTHFNGSDFFVGFIADLRDRVKMERAVRDNEARLRSLVKNIPGIVYRSKKEDGWPMVFISDAVESLTGYPASDFLAPNPKRYYSTLVHPDDAAQINDIEAAKGTFIYEYRIIHKDGSERWVIEQGSEIRDDTTGTVLIDGFIMDITERKAMEQDLQLAKERAEDAAETRAAFMANMSHEIRTPMNAILGFSDILLSENLAEESRKHANTINRSAKSLLHLLNDILDSAKLERGKLEIENRPFNLTQEVDTVVSTLWLQAKKKSLSLEVTLSPSVQSNFLGSPERIRQVLTNLLGNAIKFTAEGGVRLSVDSVKDEVRFSVVDTGIGMTEEQLSRVFDAFSQADASMSRRFGGTGLGTTISKQLVELMGGSIEAISEEGKGSTFTFYLPLKETDKADIANTDLRVELPPLNILAADDIEQNIDLLTTILKREGHLVTGVSDGQQALDALAKQNFDVVLMDLQMPNLDGLEASKKRRLMEQEQELPRTPIIALTASALDRDRIATESAGMDGFATKPIEIAALFSEIAKVLNIHVENQIPENTNVNNAALFDKHKGITLWGSEDAWRANVTDFVETLKTQCNAMRHCLETEDLAELRNMAHSLKGVSGNLALSAFMRQVAEIEYAAQREDIAAISSSLDTLALMKLKLLDEFVKDDVEEKESTVDSPFDKVQVIKCIDELLSTLSQSEYDESLIKQLMDIAGKEYKEVAAQIFDDLEEFEFELAASKLKTLRASIEK